MHRELHGDNAVEKVKFCEGKPRAGAEALAESPQAAFRKAFMERKYCEGLHTGSIPNGHHYVGLDKLNGSVCI